MLKSFSKVLAMGFAAVAFASAASAQTNIRIHTHFSQEALSGKLAGEFIDDIQTMSNGEIQVEMFYGGALVKSAEIFDAAATGIVDCDMSGGAYQTGKDPAFQFAGDLAGGYLNPYQQMSWLLHGDGYAGSLPVW